MSLDSLFDSAARGQMKAVRITQDHRVFIAEVPVPTPAEDEVLIRPAVCGLCGTDLHILHHGFPGSVYPVTPCHEFSGHIVAVGSAVRGLREGDFVAVDPNVTCGTCRWCRAGRPNLCPHLSPIGVARPGAAAELVAAPARNTFRLNTTLRADVAAMIEPLACVLHAVDSSQGVKDRDVLVMGGGTMGLLIAIVCDLFGAARVTIADPSPGKREIAARAGMVNTIDPAALGADGALGETCFDVVFEAAGVRRALEQALDHVEKTGVLVQVGVHDAEALVGINPFRVYERELRIIGSNSLADKFPAAVDVMNDIAGRASVLIGDTFPVWQFAEAAQAMAAGTSIKTQLAFL